eukprot:CAMPEP_0116895752 /NCGR_PEP_ID=MMETSP0467-20121206/5187_1 /TAXON_ID=283647 /ORGANISM="Mesodinium pulex, Strain SPMC105" /LENGTH=51 /DNA_ID=CAMNT_0004566619 /DNA_START=866 /DNA_END=1021 /DNA_ORIENTATION=-
MFHVLGFDILLDTDGQAHCLEVNGAPSVNIEHEVEIPNEDKIFKNQKKTKN